ncbi:MAG: MMPL family transporter [Pseudomonadota bacterium]
MTESAIHAGLAALWRRTVKGCYRGCLRNARLIQLAILLACVAALAFVGRFSFDASSDTLVAQGDPELAYFQQLVERFGQREALYLTYTPHEGELFSEQHVSVLKRMQDELAGVAGVLQVTSFLDVPLLRSPPVALSELAEGYGTIREGADLGLARDELTGSPLFRDLLVSADGTTTALQVELEDNVPLREAKRELDALREAEGGGVDMIEEAVAADRYRELKTAHQVARAKLIANVRTIRAAYEDSGRLYLGGVPMVSADIIDFVRRDMRLLSGAVVMLMAGALYAFFGRWRWVLIPLGTVSVTVLIMLGLLGLLGQPATAVSSNFIPLLAITTISFTIHLIARYRELCIVGFSNDHIALVYETMRSKLAPCLYTALTTAVAFASLMVSDIRPVAEFGFIMVLGIAVGLVVTYSFFAGILVMIPYGKKPKPQAQAALLTGAFSKIATARPAAILVLSVALAAAGWAGISQLSVSNRFVDYFRSGSEIRDGMVFIDENLGGTIPFEVVLELPPWQPEETDEDDDFAAFEDEEPDAFPERYWFTPARVALLDRLETYLGERAEVGKVISISTLEHIARAFNDNQPLDYLQITAVLALMPEEIKASLIRPYASPTTGELRLSARIHETGPKFSQEELFADIESFAVQELGLEREQVHVTGMAVLFNDMLKRLFSSQQSTLFAVLAAILLTFAVLLRSVRLAILGILPTALAAESVLAVMGLVGIPLDIMTITTAAIIVGIGVDDAIHYLHRFREERALGHDTLTAVRNSHASIGNALYFTSITVVVGFSVLALSSFVPTIYFGVLTALAMVLALVANLVVLPALLIKFYR